VAQEQRELLFIIGFENIGPREGNAEGSLALHEAVRQAAVHARRALGRHCRIGIMRDDAPLRHLALGIIGESLADETRIGVVNLAQVSDGQTSIVKQFFSVSAFLVGLRHSFSSLPSARQIAVSYLTREMIKKWKALNLKKTR